jgi:hypothetical protein
MGDDHWYTGPIIQQEHPVILGKLVSSSEVFAAIHKLPHIGDDREVRII